MPVRRYTPDRLDTSAIRGRHPGATDSGFRIRVRRTYGMTTLYAVRAAAYFRHAEPPSTLTTVPLT